jgi:hypothetical protein
LIFYETVNLDDIVKSQETPFLVIPAEAGIQFFQLITEFLDSGFHRSDDLLQIHQSSVNKKARLIGGLFNKWLGWKCGSVTDLCLFLGIQFS